MEFKFKKILPIFLGLTFFVLPMIVLADYQLLEPTIVGKTGTVSSPGFGVYFQWIYNSLFVVIAIITFILIVVGGFEYITSSIPSMKTSGKAKINRALTGFLIALIAWLILETISAGTFTNINFSLDSIGNSNNSAGPGGSSSIEGNGGQTNNISSNNANGPSSITEQDARNTLKAAGIVPTSTGGETSICTNGQTSGCSTYAGLQQTTIDGIIRLKNDCDSKQTGDKRCAFVLTGGTEHGDSTTGAYSHRNGYKVDIQRPSPNTDKYFTSGDFKFTGYRSGDNAPMYSNGDVIAADEGNHWDVTIKSNSGSSH